MGKNNNADIKLNIGANVSTSTELIKADLKEILEKLSSSDNLPKIKLQIDKTYMQQYLSTTLQSILDNINLTKNIDVKINQETINSNGKSSNNSSNSNSSSSSNIPTLNVKKLQEQVKVGEKTLQGYYYSTNKITKQMQSDFSQLGNYDISKSFDEKGKLQEFTVAVKDASNQIEKYVYTRAKIKTGKSIQSAFVLDSSSTSDKSGSSTISELNKAQKSLIQLTNQYNKLNNVISKTDTNSLNRLGTNLLPEFNEAKRVIESTSNEYKNLQSTLNGSSSTESKITAIENFKEKMLEASASVEKFEQTQKQSSNELTLANSLKTLQKNAESFLKANDKIKGTSLGDEYSRFLEKLSTPITDDGSFKTLKDAQGQYKTLQQRIKALGLEGQTMGTRIRAAYEKFGGWALITGSLMQAKQKLIEMLSVVKEIDSAMVELKKVTNETSGAYENFLSTAATKAKNTNSTISDTIQATSEFAKAGFNLDISSTLAESALVYKTVGDNIADIETSTNSIISTIKAFDISAMDSMEVVDKFNEVSNKFAVSSSGIGEAMSDAGAALSAAGNDIDESIAMFTAMNEIIQDDSKSSNALRTLAVKSRNTAGELEAMGEDADGAAESILALQQQVKEASGIDIMLDENTFKSTYQIMSDLNKVWGELTDVDKSTVTRLLAGTNQASTFEALVSNFDTARKALEASQEASGSAEKELNAVKDSIGGAMTELKSQFEVLSTEIIDDDFYKGVIQNGTKLLTILTNIVDVLGAKPLWITAFATGLSLITKNQGIIYAPYTQELCSRVEVQKFKNSGNYGYALCA